MNTHIFRRVVKNVSYLVLAAAVLMSGMQLPDAARYKMGVSMSAEAAAVTNRVPLVTYTRYVSGNLNTYTTSALTKRTGYICSYDKCTILRIYSNGAVQVRYPVKNGTRVAYASMSGFFINTDFSSATVKLGVGKTAYRKSTGNATVGSVYADDFVTIIGTENGRTQLIYPTVSGYKLGWISGIYSASDYNGSPQSSIAGQNQSSVNDSVASRMVSYELSQLGIGDTKGNNNVK